MTMILNRNIEAHPVNRRGFLEKLLVGAGVFSSAAIVGTVGTVIAKQDAEVTLSSPSTAATGGAPNGHEGMVMPSTETSEISAAEMDAMHKQGVQDFLRNQQ